MCVCVFVEAQEAKAGGNFFGTESGFLAGFNEEWRRKGNDKPASIKYKKNHCGTGMQKSRRFSSFNGTGNELKLPFQESRDSSST